jgi:hypothetical protein
MGGRLTRMVTGSTKAVQTGTIYGRGRPGSNASESGAGTNVSSAAGARSAIDAGAESKLASHESGAQSDWAKMLNEMSTMISSKPWDGAVAPNALKPASDGHDRRHVAVRSKQTAGKLPKRSFPSSPKSEVERNIGLVEVSLAPGSLTQNQILDVYHLLRADPNFSLVDEIAAKCKVPAEDLHNMVRYTRPFMPRMEHGLARGFYDPQKGIERFEDLR